MSAKMFGNKTVRKKCGFIDVTILDTRQLNLQDSTSTCQGYVFHTGEHFIMTSFVSLGAFCWFIVLLSGIFIPQFSDIAFFSV